MSFRTINFALIFIFVNVAYRRFVYSRINDVICVPCREQTTENMYRFVLKGSKFTPLQVRPLSCQSQRSRPHTAPAHFHKKTSPGLDESSESESGEIDNRNLGAVKVDPFKQI